MGRATQQRTLKTRAQLIAAARKIVADAGYEALRVEDVVAAATVAKGTFFAHFKDKDALMDILIGDHIDALLDDMEKTSRVTSVDDLIAITKPLLHFISSERYIFDVFLRLSGALAVEDIGKIATTLYRHDRILVGLMADSPFRKDISTDLLSEGIQSFCINAVALSFCVLHRGQDVESRLSVYLDAWLCPKC
ncbi:AcrR family transcriptional regulator [Loktanella ponticola]|uniref:AcrR family transcriptional regulator n=1 Tax=Yoonia ponticola TaxID=1524255 RepID=A0A7W9EZD4_9RHOB|nr:TetR/AcrR family transcriptional regulator [Yoonia ponticola]MBB5722035.1 AcrR family transcriptional regulator [Yoonia ponticola]